MAIRLIAGALGALLCMSVHAQSVPSIYTEQDKLIRGSDAIATLGAGTLISRMGRILGVVRAYEPGDVVGDFQIQKLAGEGAFAKVYLARQISLARQVALKVTGDVGKEARVMAGLEHDHIVQVFSETIFSTSLFS